MSSYNPTDVRPATLISGIPARSCGVFPQMPFVLAAVGSLRTLALDPNRAYTFIHGGINDSNTANTAPVFMSFGGYSNQVAPIDANFGPDLSKHVLQYLSPTCFGPNIGSVSYVSTSGINCMIGVVPGERVSMI